MLLRGLELLLEGALGWSVSVLEWIWVYIGIGIFGVVDRVGGVLIGVSERWKRAFYIGWS